MSVNAEPAVPGDGVWVKRLFEANAAVLGVNTAGLQWYRFWERRNPRERWLVVRELAFVHFLLRKDGTRTVYEIAVDRSAKRLGLGRVLMDAVGRPVRLKTDADHHESNAFYAGLGLLRVGRVVSRDGRKTLNCYEG